VVHETGGLRRRELRADRTLRRVLLRATLAAAVLATGGLVVSVRGASARSESGVSDSTVAATGCGESSRAPASDLATGSLKATRAELRSIESAIAAEQLCVTDLSEEYDQATYRLSQIDAAIITTRTKLELARKAASLAVTGLRSDALNAYMYDEPAMQIADFFSAPSETSSIGSAYVANALGSLAGGLSDLRTAQKNLSDTESSLMIERTGAENEANAARSDAAKATDETVAGEKMLSRVKGRLAAQVAQAAAQQAERDAAEVAAAANLRAKQAAALEAEQAAQVAQTLGAGSSAAAAAGKAATAAGAGASKGGGLGSPPPRPTTNPPGEIAVEEAEGFIGVPYVWGGASRAGVDCSGLTMLSWAAAGVQLAHSAAIQEQESTPVPLSQLEPGDLLFYDFDGPAGIDHVVMYVGSGPYGVDTIIQAAHTGTFVSFDQIWYQGLVGAGMP
jgi:peptidoglycan DL-endopeptidase CwlO